MEYDIAIIGGGPGGYVSAIRASQLGAKVALIEREHLGGICLNWGCIPTKAIITSSDKYNYAKKLSKFGINVENLSFDYEKVYSYKQSIVEKIRKSLGQLIKSYGIDIIYGEGIIESKHTLSIKKSDNEIQHIEFKNLLIATGSRPMSIPGITIDHKFVLDANDILALNALPESVLIVGSGPSGIEWARILSNFGKKVSIVEIAPRLAPMFDKSVSERIERMFKRQRIEYFTATKIENFQNKEVSLSNGKALTPDIVFLSIGRLPNTEIEGIDKINIEKNGKFIKVDNNLKTNIDNIYAIGDVTGILLLAHVASFQGIKAVEHILLNKNTDINYNAIPKITYGNPEIGSVGYTEDEVIAQNIEYKSSIFPMSAIGRSIVEDEIEGFVKVLSSEGKILGVHVVATQGAAFIQQAAIAINNGLSAEDITNTVFAHPTYYEALHEAFLGLNNEAIHLPKETRGIQ